MRILAPVCDLGPWDHIIALVANCAHHEANIGLAWMGISHYGLNYSLNSYKFDHSLTTVAFIPESDVSCSASQRWRPAAEPDVEVDESSILSLDEILDLGLGPLAHVVAADGELRAEWHVVVPLACEPGWVVW